MKSIENGYLHCMCTAQQGTNRITYILSPIELENEEVHNIVKTTNSNIVVIYGMDWNNDLSPWNAEGVTPNAPAFAGNASAFLKRLTDDIIPTVEKSLGYTSTPERTLAGISLSGLFALWSSFNCECFDNICSISGSLWYPGFIDWLQSQSKTTIKEAVFTLGNKESQSKNKYFRTVDSATRQTISILESQGISTRLIPTEGDHHSPLLPRISLALTALK